MIGLSELDTYNGTLGIGPPAFDAAEAGDFADAAAANPEEDEADEGDGEVTVTGAATAG